MCFVAIPNAHQDGDRLIHAGLFHHDRLESPLEGGILLDELAVFVERCGPHALQLAAGQGRLNDVGGIHRTLGRARTHNRVQLVNKEHNILHTANLIHHGLDPLFKLTAILGSGNHERHIQRDHLVAMQHFGHIARHHQVGQSLDNSRLAHAGFPQEYGVVLVAATQNLNDTLQLILASDHRVQVALNRQGRQIAPKGVQGRGLRLLRALLTG